MIESQDFVLILFLIFLEGILSIDNALVLAMLARNLPKRQQQKALTYGLIGAFVFRLLALALVTHILRLNWMKFVGGGYLVFLAGKHFLTKKPDEAEEKKTVYGQFWKVVVMIELTDVVFALDSILAAVALTSKFWVIFTGGMLGLIMMRFAAKLLIGVLDRFPKLETSAYLMVLVIGTKVIVEGLRIPNLDFHSPGHLPFWIFWGIMVVCMSIGFVGRKKPAIPVET